MSDSGAFWLGLVVLVVLFVDSQTGVDLHSALVSWLTVE